jgi:RNA polymerase-associated protein CTR9
MALLEQDVLSDKLKDDYYREAAHYLNVGERVGAESGEAVSGTLAFLTRGDSSIFVFHLLGLH